MAQPTVRSKNTPNLSRVRESTLSLILPASASASPVLIHPFHSMFCSVFLCQTWSGCGIRTHLVICCWLFTLPTILFCGTETQAQSCGKRAMLRTSSLFLLTLLTPPTWHVSDSAPYFKYFIEFHKHPKISYHFLLVQYYVWFGFNNKQRHIGKKVCCHWVNCAQFAQRTDYYLF